MYCIYAFLTSLLRPHEQHQMVDSNYFFKWQDCYKLRMQIAFDKEVEEFQNQPLN